MPRGGGRVVTTASKLVRWDVGPSATEAGALDLGVTVAPPWWALWRPRGRIVVTLDRHEAILFYQTFHKFALRAMILE